LIAAIERGGQRSSIRANPLAMAPLPLSFGSHYIIDTDHAKLLVLVLNPV